MLKIFAPLNARENAQINSKQAEPAMKKLEGTPLSPLSLLSLLSPLSLLSLLSPLSPLSGVLLLLVA